MARGHERHRRALDAGQVVHVVVERLQPAGDGVPEHLLDPPLEFTRKQADAHLLGAAEIGILAVQHRYDAGNMKAANGDLYACCEQGAGDVERARELIGLHPDQHHQATVGAADLLRDGADVHLGIGLVDGMDVEVPPRPHGLTVDGIAYQSVDRRQ